MSTDAGSDEPPTGTSLGLPAPAATKGRSFPELISGYRIVRLLGEGGMGTVYQAEQTNPTRMVALKVIKPGVSSGELLRRFEQEAEALGRLHHPGIAQIYHAGMADSGFGPQPFFAMEFIQGRGLLEYARESNLNTRARLALMARICDAVNHAHQRGIIHRDLKPGNILVDESGQPKILDFGVARVSDSDVQATRQTDLGQLVGTLPYMSPEQVLGIPQELDIRSDVYALGVILYELLADKLPYVVNGKALHEALRTILEEDPTPLSSIDRNYRGDVETIVAKALEKHKSRRYASAAELGADIRRYFADEPIIARPATTTYQLKKFARRHRTLVAGAAAVFIVLTAGVVVSTIQAVRARKAEAQAKEEATRAEAVNAFLQQMLASANPLDNRAGGRQLTMQQVLAQTVQSLDRGALTAQPLIEAGVRMTIGDTLVGLADRATAEVQFRKALALRKAHLPPIHKDIAESLQALGNVRAGTNLPQYALPTLREALAMKRQLYGDDSRQVAESERYLVTLASSAMSRGESIQIAQHALTLTRKFSGADSADTADALASIALVYELNGQSHAEERVLREAVSIYQKVDADSADFGQVLVRLSRSLVDLGRYPEAESRAREALSIYDKRHLGDHLRVLNALNPLMEALQGEGKLDEAEHVAIDAMAMSRRLFPNVMPRLAYIQRVHASVLRSQGRFDEAAALVQEACDWVKATPGPESPQYLNCLDDLARTRLLQGRPGDAELLYRDILPTMRKALGDGNTTVAVTELDLVDTLSHQQKITDVDQLFRDRIAAYRRAAAGEGNLRIMLTAAADWESSQGRGQEAEAHAREALSIAGKGLEAEDWQFVEMNSILGAALAAQKKFREAEPLLLAAYGERQDIPSMDKDAHKKIVERIAAMYQAWDRADPSAGKTAEARRWRSLI